MQFFKLQPDEKVIEEIKPLRGLKNYFLIGSLVSIGIVFGIVEIVFILATRFEWHVLLGAAIFDIIIFGLCYLIADKKYKHQYYWITNKRIIYKSGLIGYTISSIPLERISDVIISRSFFERICGFGSILIQSLAGQFGIEATLLAIPDPEGTQKMIFQLVKEKRTREKITF